MLDVRCTMSVAACGASSSASGGATSDEPANENNATEAKLRNTIGGSTAKKLVG